MLKGLSGQDLINQSLIQTNQSDKISLGNKNPYADVDKNLLIDESDISSDAISMYQKDLDIKKFTNLALSDSDNMNHNSLVAENVFNSGDSDFESKVIEGIFNNKTFLQDLFG